MPTLTPLKNLLVLTLLFLLGCANNDYDTEKINESILDSKVIYGDDNRLEHYQASSAYKTLANSTVALVKKSNLAKQSDGSYKISGSQFGSSYNLCSTEPYREQTIAAFCSGSLIAPDVVMTAGHCIKNLTDCSQVQFVFDFHVTSANSGENKTTAASNVYSCAEVIHTEVLSGGSDLALVRLDRKVTARTPLKLSSKEVQVGAPLVVIGHPVGLPQKIAGGASVRSVKADHFVANLDTYGGNSGSAVFNAQTGLVEGILVRGENDFVRQGSCNVSYRCSDDSCRGEDVTKISRVLQYIDLEDSEPVTPRPVEQENFSSTQVVSIPDNSTTGVTTSVHTGNSAPNGRKVFVKLDVAHTWRGDLVVELTAPDGKKVVLHNRSGGSLDNLVGTYGVDLIPAQALEGLSAVKTGGTWTLKVSDRASRDLGSVKGWVLIF